MKAVVVFFLSLFFLLLGGSHSVYSETHHSKISSATIQKFEKSKQVNLRNSIPGEKKEEFISVEDEDDDQVFVRKSVVPAKYVMALTYASILIYSNYRPKNRLPFCKHLSYISSYKYILQRVLKI